MATTEKKIKKEMTIRSSNLTSGYLSKKSLKQDLEKIPAYSLFIRALFKIAKEFLCGLAG